MKYFPVFRMAGFLLFIACTSVSRADDGQEVFARMGDAVITQDLLDAAFSRIDDRDRLTFIRDGKKVQDLVNQLLVNQMLANRARGEEFDQNKNIQGSIELARDKTLADAWLQEMVRRAPPADYEQMAQEYYLLHQEEFQAEPSFDVTHLLVSTQERSEDEARSITLELLDQVRADPEDFDRLVIEHSEDPAVKSNKGRYTGNTVGRMVKPFEDAALALESPGEISGLVQTQFGFHIIRLDGKTPARQRTFDEVRNQLIAIQKTDYLDNVKTRYISELVGQPLEVPEGAVEKMLKRYFGENVGQALQ